jgi:hypothetical protein
MFVGVNTTIGIDRFNPSESDPKTTTVNVD